MAKKKVELSKSGFASSLSISAVLKLPAAKSEKAGYMMCYTLDDRVLKQMEDHLIFMCDSFTIPMESKYNAGFAVKLQIDKIKLTTLSDVALITALVSIYRGGKQ